MQIDREELEKTREALREQRGKAVLEGRKFDSAKIAAVESEIAAVDDMEREKHRLAQYEAEARADANATRHRRKILQFAEEHVEAWGDLHEAVKAVVRAIMRIKTSAEAMIYHMSMFGPAPVNWTKQEVATRIGNRIAALLQKIPGQRSGFGSLKFFSSAISDCDDWAGMEARRLEPQLFKYREEKAHGNS